MFLFERSHKFIKTGIIMHTNSTLIKKSIATLPPFLAYRGNMQAISSFALTFQQEALPEPPAWCIEDTLGRINIQTRSFALSLFPYIPRSGLKPTRLPARRCIYVSQLRPNIHSATHTHTPTQAARRGHG